MKIFNIFAVVAGTMAAYSQAITIRAIQGDEVVATEAGAGTSDASGAGEEVDPTTLIPGVVEAIFNIGDADQSGVIDREELKKMLKEMREMFQKADKVAGACDGEVSPEDLTAAIMAEMTKDDGAAGGDDGAAGDAAKTE